MIDQHEDRDARSAAKDVLLELDGPA